MRWSESARNAKLNAVTALFDGAFLDIYDGTYPAQPLAALTGQTRLARLGFATPAFRPALHGQATAFPLTPEPAAPSSGHARWFRVLRPPQTLVVEGVIGTENAPLVLSTTEILIGTRLEISSLILTEPSTS